MKKLIATALLGAGLLAGTAQAEQVGGLYIGITGGIDKIDAEGFAVDDGNAVGIMLGMRFSSGLAAEVSAIKSDADITSPGSCEADYKTVGLYGAWRSSGDAYFKARVGLVHEDVDAPCLISDTDTSLSLGAGAGIRFGNVAVEAEYTFIDSLTEERVDRFGVNFLVNF